MQKSKSNRLQDQLSELPDSVIFHIFWFMPMTSVVRTTVLSKRWKNLWTVNPYLNFDCSELDDDEVRVRNFVNRALLSWRGIKILKFRCYPTDSLCSDLKLWVCFAVDKNVEELYVHRDKLEHWVYLVPQCLYSCSSLKVLLLEDCELEIRGNVQWNQLKSLTIVGGSNYRWALDQILLGSPKLEVFILALGNYCGKLNIRSNSLRRLTFENCFYYYNPSNNIELRIWTPNLEMLEISGVPFEKYMLMNISSLTDVILGFYGVNHCDYFPTKDIDLWERLRPILTTIQHVEKVRLSDWCIKVIGDARRKHLLSPFPNVKFLKLHARRVQYEQIFSLLEIFPKLKMLVLQDENIKKRYHVHTESPKFDAKSILKFEGNLPKAFLQQLRTVEITWAESDNSIFPFIEILLKHASNLEKMVIRGIQVKGKMPSSDSLILASQKLLGMLRSSSNCRVSLL